MSRADNLLSRLDKIKRTGNGMWTACCPAHDDRGPSLTIRELDDGRVLLHCFAGCSVHEVLTAVDMDMAALFPEKEITHCKPERRPFPAADALQAVAFEALVVSAAASSMLAGQPLPAVDRERLTVAASRIQSALSAAMPQFRGARHV